MGLLVGSNASSYWKERSTNYSSGSTSKTTTTNVKSNLDSVVDAVISSGKTINPNINFDNITLEQFLVEAEKTIAPEYKQKFNVAISDLDTVLSRLGYDLSTGIEEVNRQAQRTRLQGRESYAGRGTAFSSARNRFESDVNEAEQRDIDKGRELTFRTGQDAFTATERYLGTTGLKNQNVNRELAGRTLQFGNSSVVGSMESERQFAKESIARQLMNDEYQRRAFTLSSLGFQ